MREHLFKGFRKLPEGKQIISVGGKEIRGKWIEGDVGRKCCISEDGSSPFWHVVPETVSEFTGKKDKNGIKIFENHVCEHTFAEYKSRWKIRWDKDYSRFCADGMSKDNDFSCNLDSQFAVNCEVVGDIFETRAASSYE